MRPVMEPGASSVSGGTLAIELRRYETRARQLRALVRDTRRALRDVADVRLIEEWAQNGVSEVGSIAARAPALVILGRCTSARARLTNALLGDNVLPTDDPRGGWRWIRLQYGICKQVRLSLGNSEFEVVETLQCNKKSWEVLPLEDLRRRDDSDLVTILDIELKSPILSDGLVIMIPPDLGSDTSGQHNEFYTKRDAILNSYTPVYLFALDILGKIKTHKSNNKTLSETKSLNRLEENADVFCSVDNMYNFNELIEPQDLVTNCDNKENIGSVLRNCDIDLSRKCGECVSSCKCGQLEKHCNGDGKVLNQENLHDIRTANRPYNNSHMLFVLFSNSPEQQNTSKPPCQLENNLQKHLEKQEIDTNSQEEQQILQQSGTDPNDLMLDVRKTTNKPQTTETSQHRHTQNEESIISHNEPTITHQEHITTYQEHTNSTNELMVEERLHQDSNEGKTQEPTTSHKKHTPQNESTLSAEGAEVLHIKPTLPYNNLPIIWHKETIIPPQEPITSQHYHTLSHHKVEISHKEPIVSLQEQVISKNKLETEATESTENKYMDMFNELPESERSLSKSPKVILTDKLQSVIKNGDFVRDGCRRSKKRRGKPNPGNSKVDGINDLKFDHKRAFMIDLVEKLEVSSNINSKKYFNGSWLVLDDEKLIERRRQRRNPLNMFKTMMEPTFIQPRKNILSPQNKGRSARIDRCQFDSSDSTEDKGVVSDYDKLYSVLTKFVANSLRSNLLENCTRLSEIHTSLLQQFILASFDMAREIQVVPKKIQYVAVTEQHLYDTLTEKFAGGEKKEELLEMMQKILQDMKNTINNTDWRIDDLQCHQETDLNSTYNSVFYCPTPLTRVPSSRNSLYTGSINSSMVTGCSQRDTEEADSFENFSFDDYDIICTEELLNSESSETQGSSISEERPTTIESSSAADLLIPNGIEASEDSYKSQSVIKILNLGQESGGDSGSVMSSTRCTTRSSQVSIKQASLEVQKLVLDTLSNNISVQLVQFVDCLRETYFGTLQRCIESLEESCREELGGLPATEAVRQVLNAARAVDLAGCASFSMLRTLVEHLRRFFYKLKVVQGSGVGSACCVRSPRWRRQVALQTIHSLSAARLTRIISMQIRERLRTSHERYQAALLSLETALAGRLHHTEDVKLSVRKRYAPGFARLCLESTSMCDLLKYGVPSMGREIGRGQYGVVFSCTAPWGGHEPCAVKSVLPADERHYNELAMEFFYTRSIPAHPRIVRLWGSVVERQSGGSPTVLLVTQRLTRDLYCAIRTGDLLATQRMQIAIDIVQGIRYLHSLGLVHRDITKKNVLLDQSHRAKLTDLGFCVPEALMSGSVVGTPIHMAPELLTGDYDSSVDIYAFGILFWYLCAGHAHLPTAFEVFKSKEQLWSRVRKGLRPERLSQFSDQAWNLMESCWAGDPSQRPLLGDVQPILEQLMAESEQQSLANTLSTDEDITLHKWNSPDELSMIWSKNYVRHS